MMVVGYCTAGWAKASYLVAGMLWDFSSVGAAVGAAMVGAPVGGCDGDAFAGLPVLFCAASESLLLPVLFTVPFSDDVLLEFSFVEFKRRRRAAEALLAVEAGAESAQVGSGC